MTTHRTNLRPEDISCAACNGIGVYRDGTACPQCDRIAELCARLETIEADAQALADVRTLDEWAGQETAALMSRSGVAREHTLQRDKVSCVAHLTDLITNDDQSFDDFTPEGARAKAAEWVRKQAVTTSEGLK